MKSSFKSAKKSLKQASKKTMVFLLVFVMLFSFLLTPLKTAKAQLAVTDPVLAAQNVAKSAFDKAKAALSKLLLKAGATSFQQVVRTALNKIAYDTATYLGSGNKGQKPLFITQGWGSYLANVGDAAAGQFIENFAVNLGSSISSECQQKYQVCAKACGASYSASSTDAQILEQSNACMQTCKTAANKCGSVGNAVTVTGLNVCQPSSLEAKVKIGLGLVQKNAPVANCTATQMINNWGDEATKIADWKDEKFLSNIKNIFDPTSNDLGIYMSARTTLASAEVSASTVSLNNLVANKGWLSKTNAAGESVGVPGDAETKAQTTEAAQKNSLLRTTGDIVVDAANVFVNQFAITKFNSLMSNLGKKASSGSGSGSGSSASLTNAESDFNVSYGEEQLKESLSSIIKPDFGVKADYDVLTSLSVCSDATNPGPTDCVIDDKFAEGIKENKTVIEAVKAGFINGDWQLTKDTAENTYSLRNISILRKYRILPIGWEEAINEASANSYKVTVMDLISCFSNDDEYNQFSNDFVNKDKTWCLGLVDPNWVLKAPLNYCSKQGVGAQVTSEMVTPSSTSGGIYTASTYNLTRGENYCADEKTCIKEKADGSCEAYGYCNEEKRTWNFSSDGCDPTYNTCQSFTNANSGKSVSYLKNTLNYSGCDANSAGCRQYSVFGSYDTSKGTVGWSSTNSIYLNETTTACNSKDEACTELLRTKPTWGSNLLMDSDFNREAVNASSTGAKLNDWAFQASGASGKLSIVDAAAQYIGSGKALKAEATGGSGNVSIGVYSNDNNSLLPSNFQPVAGQAYTVSADVYLNKGDSVSLYMGDSASEGYAQSSSESGNWVHLSATRTASGSYNSPSFGIIAGSTSGAASFYLQHLKFEVSNYDTGHNIYGSTYKVYEKLIPPYLESTCYNNASGATKDYTLKTGAPDVCYNYARRCNRDEAGCEKFTGVKDGISVSAQVTASDYCWDDCVGYDVFISKENYFNSPKAENMIPNKTTACNADAAGCSEFTNLDELKAGGESKEYYSSMKQCVKPGQATCGNFYSWEGTENGYQLRSYTLAQTSNQPKLVSGSVNSDDCNQEIYNKTVGETGYNADCHEFYNSTGQVFYALLSSTITCSDDCHAYRMSEKNIDKTLTSAAACTSSDNSKGYHWDSTANVCYACINGGTWDTENNACVYQAIPGEGKTCAAAQNGCREFNGNGGNNVQLITSYDFEDGLGAWTSNNRNLTVTPIANEKDGHSAEYLHTGSTIARVGVGNLVTEGKAYSIRFIAKASQATNLKIYFTDNANSPKTAVFSGNAVAVKGGGEWNIYQATLDNLDHTVSDNETLSIEADGDFFFDDFSITEITDRYYLISGSSKVPDICSYDTNNVYQGEDYNLGCAQYTDRDSLTHTLRKFSKLCSSSAVGCEQLIATQNYSPYYGGIWGDTNSNGVCDENEKDCVKVDGDKAIYAVFDSSKQCNSADLGCSRLGQLSSTGSGWSDVFKNNNPNLYSSILCGQKEVGCEKWTTDDGTINYFRDPGNETCQYRTSHNPTVSGKAWYKIPVKRCDLDGSGTINATEKAGKVCTADSDCASGTCIVDNNDYPCAVSSLKTFGIGGYGNQVPVPSEQAGLCQATASGCTEYLDPVSKFSINLVNDPNFTVGDSWNGPEQTVAISPNKVYILTVDNTTGTRATTLTFSGPAAELLVSNNLDATTTTLSLPAGKSGRLTFASLGNSSVLINGGQLGKNIELKEAVVNYQLQENIDTKSCNGAVNFDNGCVLFNERSVNGASGLVSMAGKFDAVNSVDKKAPVNCGTTGVCNANKLIKVSPNRVCSKWLDCLTYVNDPNTNARTCYAVGECTRLDDKNECANFEDSTSSVATFDNSNQSQNASGYYLLNQYHLDNMREVGLNTDAHYDFEDSAPSLSCKRVGGGECSFNKNIIKDLLVREPEGAPTNYPAHGASYLKVPASYLISPQTKNNTITVKPSNNYYLNFLVNTKNSGIAARVMIVSVSSTGGESTIVDTTFTSNTGWSRQILPFSTDTTSSNTIKAIKIYLGATPNTSDRTVYFDDLNIEPVLETGKIGNTVQYAARECRLYPTNDSLTCVNKNNNVLKDGWEGYCLVHDPDNANVCLMWYPVDKISSEKTLQASAGYQGIFPLNYCTEINGNFDLVKKITGSIMEYSNRNNFFNDSCVIYNNYCLDNPDVNYVTISAEGWVGNFARRICLPKYNKLLVANNAEPIKNSNDGGIGMYGCNFIGTTGQVTSNTDNTWVCNSGVSSFNLNNCTKASAVGANIDGIPIMDYLSHYFNNGKSTTIYPTEIAYQEGWVPYYQGSTTVFTGFKKYVPLNNNYPGIDESSVSATNPVRVYDYDNPPVNEDNLKLIGSGDSDNDYRLTCNTFVQTVDSNGENMAWAARTGVNSNYPTSTPPFFIEKNSSNQLSYYGSTTAGITNHAIANYGRNRETTPFGAASWPDSFNLLSSEPVKLKYQFSNKNNEDVLAGRPYGCTNAVGKGQGCAHIGYCSLNPSVYCLTGNDTYLIVNGRASTTDYVSRASCAGGGMGTCLPLWSNQLGAFDNAKNYGLKDYQMILRTLFLKSYNSFSLVNGTYTSVDAGWKQPVPLNQCVDGNVRNKRPDAASSAQSASNSLCVVYPSVDNMSLNNQSTAKVSAKGIYGLRFTSFIDQEQEPLKEIYIDWGDGSTQVITGQDGHPSTANPHIFYHYYKKAISGQNITVEVRDNWDAYNNVSSNNGKLKLN